MSAAIEVSGLLKRYGDVTAVDRVSFAVRTGEIFGMVGPNGAGKTTTIECIEGLRQPDDGRITTLGLDRHVNLYAIAAFPAMPLRVPFLPQFLDDAIEASLLLRVIREILQEFVAIMAASSMYAA